MIKKLNRLNRRGDTIVEVLIALAILGLAFGISYSTAHRSLLSTRNSQEHSEALQFLSSQIELIRANVNTQQEASPVFNYVDGNFCMDVANDQPVDASSDRCFVGTEQLNGKGLFNISISYAPTPVGGVNQDIFTLTITWPGVGQMGQQREQLSYKIHPNDAL